MRIVIVGAGGHGQVVASIIQQSNKLKCIGFVDDDVFSIGKKILGIPVLGQLAKMPAIPHEAVVIAIGNNQIRSQIFAELSTNNEKFITIIHAQTIVADDVMIGDGCMVIAGVIINTGTTIGKNTILNTGCTVDHHNKIGSHVHIAPGVNLGGGVQIGNGTLVGIGSTVMPQCKVGEGSIIGAGSLVTKDIPDNVVAVGMPAKIIRKL